MPLDLSDLVLQRALAQMTPSKPAQVASAPARELSPALLAVLGALGDGVSTHHMLRQGGSEDNPALKGMSPAMTGAMSTGVGLAGLAASKLIGKKWPRVGRALTGNLAGAQIGTAANNFDLSQSTSTRRYHDAVMRALRQE